MAKYPDFIGGFDSLRCPKSNAERTVNWYQETADRLSATSRKRLMPTPGIAVFSQPFGSAGGYHRAAFFQNNRSFVVVGDSFWEINNAGAGNVWGTVENDGLPATIHSNGVQLFIVSGGLGYIFDLTTNTFSQITDPDFPNPCAMGTYLDGYFIALKKDTRQLSASALFDGLDWPALYFTNVSMDTDRVMAITSEFRELIVFGEQNSHIYIDTAATGFPFTPLAGVQIEQGIVAPFSFGSIDNTVLWLGGDDRGAGTVWRLNGYQPVRVSTYALEQKINSYTVLDATIYGTLRISDAVSWVYEDAGHFFYCLYFISADKTWVYDIREDSWHERTWFNPTTSLEEAHRGRTHMFAFGYHLVGDRLGGNLFVMSDKLYDDNVTAGEPRGGPIRRTRQAPHLLDELKWIFYHLIEFNLCADPQAVQVDETPSTPAVVAVCPETQPSLDMEYSEQLTATGGTPPYTWTEVDLPPGLTLSSSGLLSGTMTGLGSGEYTFTVTDSLGTSDTITCPIAAFVTTECPDIADPVLEELYQFQMEATGGIAPYTWELVEESDGGLGPFPEGISISEDGLISGTPTETGTFPFTIRVTDSVDNFTEIDCEFVIESPQDTIAADMIYSDTSPREAAAGDNASRNFFLLTSEGVLYRSKMEVPSNVFPVWSTMTLPAGNWLKFGTTSANEGQALLFGSDAFIATKPILTGVDPDIYIDQPWTKYALPAVLHGGGTNISPSDVWTPTPNPNPIPTGALNGTTMYCGQSTPTALNATTYDVWTDNTNTTPVAFNKVLSRNGSGTGNAFPNSTMAGVGQDVVYRWSDFYSDTDWVLVSTVAGNWVDLDCDQGDVTVCVADSTSSNFIQVSTDGLQTFSAVTPPVGWAPVSGVGLRVMYDPNLGYVTPGHVADTDGVFLISGGEIAGVSVIIALPLLTSTGLLGTAVVCTTPAVPAGTKWTAIARNYIYQGVLIVGTEPGPTTHILSNDEVGLDSGTPAQLDDWQLRTLSDTPFQ